ncbi:MAG: glutathione S-transferase family protein, partial [Acidobacteriota bacterium]
VLQVGADVYCDSQLIVAEIERRYPERTIFPGASEGTSWMLSRWSDQPFFQATVAIIFGSIPDGALPQGFIEDREQLSGRPFDLEAMKAAAPLMLSQWQAHADFVERQLADQAEIGNEWLLGSEPSFGDITAYMNFWFVSNMHPGGAGILSGYPYVQAWMQRVAALGHGERQEISAEEALRRGTESSPEAAGNPSVELVNASIGDRVQVMPDDYGRIPVTGELVGLSKQRLSVRREDEEAGEVVVHFPRAGYLLNPL